MNKTNTPLTDNTLITREATLADDEALRELIAVPMTTKGIQISFQREPSYFKASDILYRHKLHVVIEDTESQKKVACYSNGYRPCYINRNIQNLRYAGDLRVDHSYRGKSLVKVLGKHVKQTMHEPNYSQMIIFDDNHAARAAIQTGKTGMPDYYDEGLIETLSLTDLGAKRKITAFLKQNSQQSHLQEIRTCTAKAEHVPAMNQFIADMAEFYNFIPAYNFEELAQGHRYFSGMKLSDFSLYFKGEKLVGMFGLWDQHSIKQTKILNYSSAIAVLRPVYNLLTPMTKGMRLPKLGDSIQYHVLHTLMCHPQDLALHHKMLEDAYNKSKLQGVGVVSFTLSHRDPRYQLNQFYKGERLTGMHGFISFEGDPRPSFDKKLIPYLEVGRI
ncbi:hypothetical protein AB0T70_08780 [Acinetobacter baumannii]|uniref:hypothetical protein n=1 Tax=Acinetobacter baumannii TaxID=470 RepID=UPI0002AECE2B|nr:hypothetical protein [Acinetobacter baumannii]ELW93005.1 hypothetical protein ACINAA014_1949 [Acinetobacter baumannii AA-014]MBD0074482.1 hypothetical protein [Acinetobacter baumannii]MBD0087677.1 hypothetical protein [Acinetobacter baumannii]MBD0095626.1 hypothetical protein [Acinetobacter baumannii]MBD0117307.1 hypothetical protein [Acinetobacter baumannii]